MAVLESAEFKLGRGHWTPSIFQKLGLFPAVGSSGASGSRETVEVRRRRLVVAVSDGGLQRGHWLRHWVREVRGQLKEDDPGKGTSNKRA